MAYRPPAEVYRWMSCLNFKALFWLTFILISIETVKRPYIITKEEFKSSLARQIKLEVYQSGN